MKKKLTLLLALSLFSGMVFATGSQEEGTAVQKDSNIVYDGSFGKIVTESVELKIHLSQENKNVLTTDLPLYRYLSETTGIDIIGTANPGSGDSLSEFYLAAANGFPDDIYAGNKLGNLFMKFGAEGAFIPLNDYLDQMPNFSAFMKKDPRVAASITSPDGNIYFIPYMQPDVTTSKVYFIRKDWLEKFNLPMPGSTEELEKTLLTLIQNDANGNGQNDEFGFFGRNIEEIVRLVTLFGSRAFGNDSFSQRFIPADGEVYHAWIQPEFMEAIKEVSRWYDLGIIDNEYLTNPRGRRDHFLLNNLGAMTYDWMASTSGYNNKNIVDGFELAPFAPPVNVDGNRVNEHIRPIVKNDGWGISAQCENVEAAIALFDMMFTEYGRTVANFGVEGKQWEYVNGLPTFTEAVLNNPEGKPVNLYLRDNVGAQLFIGFKQDYEYERQWTSEGGLKAIDIYGSGEFDVPTLPALVYTDEEFEIVNKYLSNINTFLDESVHSWIVSPSSHLTDEVWDKYLSQVNKLGLEDIDAVYQTAYKRYMDNTK